MDKVVEFGLDYYVEVIFEISMDVMKELFVENTLRGIVDVWINVVFDIGLFKEGCDDVMKLRSVDDIFIVLEDNIVILSILKVSKFFFVFERIITSWEKTFGVVNDVVEMVFKV